MSHRTKDLPPATGIGRALRELRYHEVSRQLLGIVLIFVFAATAEPTGLLVAVGAPLAVLGTLVRLYASGFITKNSELARNGPYALVRHPLYTGNILVVVGLGIANGHWWALPLGALFFWFYYPTAIEYEDRKLHGIFGAEWEKWAASVPALVPKFHNMQGVAGGEWSLARSFKRNGEVLIAAYILGCVYWVAQMVL
jgi:protein-S-isoprenylcysteine O-methyltransferase Ste14